MEIQMKALFQTTVPNSTRPAEGLNLELQPWLKPETKKGSANRNLAGDRPPACGAASLTRSHCALGEG